MQTFPTKIFLSEQILQSTGAEENHINWTKIKVYQLLFLNMYFVKRELKFCSANKFYHIKYWDQMRSNHFIISSANKMSYCFGVFGQLFRGYQGKNYKIAFDPLLPRLSSHLEVESDQTKSNAHGVLPDQNYRVWDFCSNLQ